MSHGGEPVVTEKTQQGPDWLGAGDLTVLCHAAHHSTLWQKRKGVEAQVDDIKRSTGISGQVPFPTMYERVSTNSKGKPLNFLSWVSPLPLPRFLPEF